MRSEPSTEAPRGLRNTGDLFTQCRHRYGLTPEEVLGLIGVADAEGLADGVDLEEALALIEQRVMLRSGRMLRPAAGWTALVKKLDEAERRAWASLREFRFQEFGHWAEVWASLARISGEGRKNPFGAVAAVGRNQGKRGGRGDG